MLQEIWIDANLPPSLAKWITHSLGHAAYSFAFLGALTSNDFSVFQNAKARNNIIILTKDEDYVSLVEKYGPPPKIIWVTIGNCSKEKLKELIMSKMPSAIDMLNESPIVELTNFN